MDPRVRKRHRAFVDFDNDDSATCAVFWGEGMRYRCRLGSEACSNVVGGKDALDAFDFPKAGNRPWRR